MADALPRPTAATPPQATPWMEALTSLGLWVLSLVVLILLPNMIALPYVIYRYRGMENVGQLAMSDPIVIFLTVLGMIPAHLVTFVAAWAIVTRAGKRPFWRTLGWSWGRGFGVWSCAGLALSLYVMGYIVAKLIGNDAPTDIEALIHSSTATRITLAVLAAATAPLVEEILYRGVIYSAFEKTIGTVWTVILVSFLFSFVHFYQYRNNIGVITVIVILSLTLTMVRALSGQLLPCFIIHLVYNGVQSLLLVFYPYLEQIEKGAEQKTGLVLLSLGRLLPFLQHGL